MQFLPGKANVQDIPHGVEPKMGLCIRVKLCRNEKTRTTGKCKTLLRSISFFSHLPACPQILIGYGIPVSSRLPA